MSDWWRKGPCAGLLSSAKNLSAAGEASRTRNGRMALQVLDEIEAAEER
jgi:hypothetical protein